MTIFQTCLRCIKLIPLSPVVVRLTARNTDTDIVVLIDGIRSFDIGVHGVKASVTDFKAVIARVKDRLGVDGDNTAACIGGHNRTRSFIDLNTLHIIHINEIHT